MILYCIRKQKLVSQDRILAVHHYKAALSGTSQHILHLWTHRNIYMVSGDITLVSMRPHLSIHFSVGALMNQ
jgi:hypothetical protein